MRDPTYPLFPVFAFLGFILPLIPLPWHLQAMNSGTCYFIFWASLASLNQFINAIVWAGNVANFSPGWCELSIRIAMAASVGIPAASLCINRRLYHIANAQGHGMTLAEKRRVVLIDSLICGLFPLIFVALQYIVQGHRFDILEDIGCFPAIFNTLPAFFISSAPPLIIGLISSFYCILTLCSFARRRVEFNRFFASQKTLTLSRYFRLMALALTDICLTVPLSIFVIWLNATAAPVRPWISWEDTHFNYSRIEQIPSVIWRGSHLISISVEFDRWVNPVCGFIFFGFFGFAYESKKNYRCAWNWLKKTLLRGSWSGTDQKVIPLQLRAPVAPSPSFTVNSLDVKRIDPFNASKMANTNTIDSTIFIIYPPKESISSSTSTFGEVPLERLMTV